MSLRQWLRGRVLRTLLLTVVRFNKIAWRFSKVKGHGFYDAAQFDWVPALEAHWAPVRRELDEVLLPNRSRIPNLEHVLGGVSENLSGGKEWKTFFLHGYGHAMKDNWSICPRTAEALRAVRGLRTAFFSILPPGAHVPVHQGAYAGVLRCLFALRVPRDRASCRIRVGEEIRHWEEGRCMILDDTLLHEVWNDTDEDRAVLYIDFLRPLPWPLALVNRLLVHLIRLTYFRHAIRNHRDWERAPATAELRKAAQG